MFFYDPNFSDGHKIWTLAPRDLIFFWNDHHGLLCHAVWCLNPFPIHNHDQNAVKVDISFFPFHVPSDSGAPGESKIWENYVLVIGSNTIQHDKGVHDGHFKKKIRSLGARVRFYVRQKNLDHKKTFFKIFLMYFIYF